MIRNYLKIALRNIQRRKSYSIINILGLTFGLASCLIIFCVVRYHLSFDNYHEESNRIYRIVSEIHQDDINYLPSVANPLGKAFRDEYTLADKVGRICTFKKKIIALDLNGEIKKFQERQIAFPELEFFDLFTYELLNGDIKTALTEPHTAVLAERIAKKYFGDENPINKTFRLDNRIDFRITGVFKDIPVNTDIRAEVFLSYSTLLEYDEWFGSDDSWGGIFGDMWSFVRLKHETSVEESENAFTNLLMKYQPDWKNIVYFKLQPLNDIHFNPHYGGTIEKKNLWILSAIGLFIIIAACINFINLATAQAINRSKEIGVRKVLGSNRKQLFWQFILETGVVTMIATLCAFCVSFLTFPYLDKWFTEPINLNPLSDQLLIFFIPILIIIVTFLSGSYPALVLSRFLPALALKGKHKQGYGTFNIRRLLIVVQLTLSQILIIGLIVIVYQLKFVKESGMGFSKEAVVMIPTGSKDEKSKTLKNQFIQTAGVETATLCSSPPATVSLDTWNTDIQYDSRAESEPYSVSLKAVDENYLSTFSLKLVTGKNLSVSDTVREFLVNETFVEKLNLINPEDIIGRTITISGGEWHGPVVGVVRDFNDRSFHEEIKPVVFTTLLDEYSLYAVKIQSTRLSETLLSLNSTWSQMYPDKVYEYAYLDKQIEEFYNTEEAISKLIQAFSFIAICIGCIGLYGLVSFLTKSKTKEIGIRKVLGGDIRQILWIFGKEFFWLILLVFVLATPIGWWLMNEWLANFKYRIDLSFWIFMAATVVTSFIALMTVGYQSFKASLMNPVDSLKGE